MRFPNTDMKFLSQVAAKILSRRILPSPINNKLRIGVVGYSNQAFDREKAMQSLRDGFDLFEGVRNVEIVSGLTDLGIPALAYREAVRRGWTTVGVACAKAVKYKCFSVDRRIIVGEKWGDESSAFLSMIDVLIRVGGGEQACAETRAAKLQGKQVIEFELPALLSV